MSLNDMQDEIRESLERKLSCYLGTSPEDATKKQMYKAVILCVKDILMQKRSEFKEQVKKQRAKKVYYMCMEFLVGRSLKNNLCNLGLCDAYEEALGKMGHNLEELYDCEPDAGLGNGGLGLRPALWIR